MKYGELMDRSGKFVLPSDTARDAARRMRDENLSFLPVCDNSGRTVGGVSDRDMTLRLIAEDHPATTHVREVMSREYQTALETDEVTEESDLPVIVTDGYGKLRGVVTPGSARMARRGAGRAQASAAR